MGSETESDLKNLKWMPHLLAVMVGLAYGVLLRVALLPGNGARVVHWYTRFLPGNLWVMTFGFLGLVPFAVGWLVVAAAPTDEQNHWERWIVSPWVAMILSHAAVLVLNFEGLICVIMALPITLVFSTFGGVTAGLVRRNRARRKGTMTLCVAVLPMLLAAAEVQFQGPLQVRTVETSIAIHAPAETVWRNIERVPAIRPAELRPTWTHRMGFPLPVEATLDHGGVGGVRHASFAHGLVFIETITEWDPARRIGFTIKADTEHIPPTTLDEHVTIGGRYFDVLNGEYRLEPRADGAIELHLSSRERVSTDFNWYAGLWSDGVMRDLQESILQVVKQRCEAQGATLSAAREP